MTACFPRLAVLKARLGTAIPWPWKATFSRAQNASQSESEGGQRTHFTPLLYGILTRWSKEQGEHFAGVRGLVTGSLPHGS